MSICSGPEVCGSRAGAAAAAAPVRGAGVSPGATGSGSRTSAPRPRPKAFLGIGDDLLGELRIALRPLAVYIIENNRFTEARRFCQAYIARNDALKDLSPEKTAQVGRDLSGKRGALVIHGEQNAFDFETWV